MAYHPFRHLGLKALAVALAVVLWLTVAGEHVVDRSMRVPLEFRNVPEQLVLVGDPPTAVDVRVRGASTLLSRLVPGEVIAMVDVSDARPGSRLFNIRADEIRAPYGVHVEQIIPSTIQLELEKSGRRRVPIAPAVEGDPAPGFVVGRVASDPETVEVIGPESRLKELSGATTEPVSVAGARDRVRDLVNVGVSDTALRLAQSLRANVSVEILPAPVEREVAGVPIRWRNLGQGLRASVRPTLTRLTVRGKAESLSNVRAEGLEAFVDLAGLGPGRYNLRIQVEPSPNVGVIAIAPALADVTIR